MEHTSLSGVVLTRGKSSSEYILYDDTHIVLVIIQYVLLFLITNSTDYLYSNTTNNKKRVLRSGKILIPQIEVIPTAVVANGDRPPELEIRFDMPYGPDFVDMKAKLPPNWQLRFIHNQLFKHFYNPSRFCPGAFHSTIVRKAEFRSQEVCVNVVCR